MIQFFYDMTLSQPAWLFEANGWPLLLESKCPLMPRHSVIVGSTAGHKITLYQNVQHYNLIETNLIVSVILEICKMWCWKRKEKFSRSDHVKKWRILYRVMEEGNVLHAIKRRKANRTSQILHTNCFVKNFIEGKIQRSRRRERRSKQLLDVIQETERHWKLK